MKKQFLIWTLILTILTVFMIIGCGGDDDNGSTTGPSISVADNIPGTWLTTTILMSGMPLHQALGITMKATFAENMDLDVTLTQIPPDVTPPDTTTYEFAGNYELNNTTMVMNLTGAMGSTKLTGEITMNTTTTATYVVGMPYSLINTLSPTFAPILFGTPPDTTKTIPATFTLSKQN